MRIPLIALAAPVLLAVPMIVPAAVLLSGSAAAQVTIDLRALDPLPLPGQFPYRAPSSPPPRPPAPPKPRVATPAVPPTPALPTPAPAATASASGASPASTAPPASTATAEQQAPLPIVTPPAADIQPVPPPPMASSAPPPPPPVSATATTRAEPVQAGIQVLFDATTTDLSPASLAAIKAFAGTAPNTDSVSFNVLAYAAGKTDDPSVARRLSLSRALAVRSALVAEGVASTRIYVRALGSQTEGGPPDRVDLSLLGANAAAPR
jgi:outer membrane protein OmpA-like peptidoglycan-associated protein